LTEDDTKPVGLIPAEHEPTIEDIKSCLRADLDGLVAEGSEEFDAAVVMLTALLLTNTDEGAEERIATLTGMLPARVGEFARRLREANIWVDGGTNAENGNAWMDEVHGCLAILIDALVAVGRLRRDGDAYARLPSPPSVEPVSFRRTYYRSALLRKLILEAIAKVGPEFTAAHILAAIQKEPGHEQLERQKVGMALQKMTKDGLLSVTRRGPLGNLYQLLLGTGRIAS
jgi:hypothetical protein